MRFLLCLPEKKDFDAFLTPKCVFFFFFTENVQKIFVLSRNFALVSTFIFLIQFGLHLCKSYLFYFTISSEIAIDLFAIAGNSVTLNTPVNIAIAQSEHLPKNCGSISKCIT